MLLVFDLEVTVKGCGFVIAIFHMYSKESERVSV